MSASKGKRYDGSNIDNIGPAYFSNGTHVVAGLSSIVLGTGLFVGLISQFSSFPIFSLSPVTYVTSLSNFVWGILSFAIATGVAVSTAYWYCVRATPMIRDYVVSPTKVFVYSFIPTFILFNIIWYLRLLVMLLAGVLFFILILAGPILFLLARDERNIWKQFVSLMFLGFWLGIFYSLELNFAYNQIIRIWLLLLLPVIMIFLPPLFNPVDTVITSFKGELDDIGEKIVELDVAIRELDHSYLARYGLELPYKRASADPKAVRESNDDVYVPPPEKEFIISMAVYYRELYSFERQLVSTAKKTEGPTAVMQNICAILDVRHPESSEVARDEVTVIEACEDVLESYTALVTKGDVSGISELESRLDRIRSDVSSDVYESDSVELAEELRDIRRWVDDRTSSLDLQSQQSELRDRWSRTPESVFDLDTQVFDQLTTSDSGETSAPVTQFGLETAERLVRLASSVQTVQDDEKTLDLDPLSETFGRYLKKGDITSERLDVLEAGLTVIQTCSTAKRRYPSYPFDRVVEQLFSELENGAVDDEIKIFLELGEGAEDVLDFLEDSDTEHPSVQPDQWKNDIRTGLENVSPEIIRPLVNLVDRMDEALWERRHLHEFSWEEFERLVADVFESKGYETRVTQSSSDKGIDI